MLYLNWKFTGYEIYDSKINLFLKDNFYKEKIIIIKIQDEIVRFNVGSVINHSIKSFFISDLGDHYYNIFIKTETGEILDIEWRGLMPKIEDIIQI